MLLCTESNDRVGKGCKPLWVCNAPIALPAVPGRCYNSHGGAFLGGASLDKVMVKGKLMVAVAGGFRLTRAALVDLIDRLPGLQAAPLGSAARPDVLVWDADQDDRTFADLQARFQGVPVLVLAGHMPPARALDFLQSGALGCMPKSEPPEAVSLAIRQIARGESYLPSELAVAILAIMQPAPAVVATDEPGPSALSAREQEVLGLLCHGLNNKAIAARLYLSVRTVEGHIQGLYSKLGVHNRTEAALLGMRLGLHERIT